MSGGRLVVFLVVVDNDDDWDDWEPPPDASKRTWRHPSEIAAEAAAEAAKADNRWRTFTSRGTFVAGVLAGAGICLIGLASIRFASTPDATLTLQAAPTTRPEPIGALNPIDFVDDEPTTTTTAATTLTLLTQPVHTAAQSAVSVAPEPLPGGMVLIRVSGDTVATGVAIDGLVLTSAAVVGTAPVVGLEQHATRTTGNVIATDPFSDIAIIGYDREVGFGELDEPEAMLPSVGASVSIVGSTVDDESSQANGSLIATGQIIRSTTGHPVVGSIQTSAERSPLLPGALLTNANGEPVGIVVSGESYLAAAIPLADARTIARTMIHHGWASETWLGVRGVVVDDGIKITSITDHSPANALGLQVDDVLVTLDDEPLDTIASLVGKLRMHQPADTVTIGLIRAGEELAVDVPLGTRSLGPEAN